MSPEKLFSLASTIALVGWIILALAPFRRLSAITAARLIAALLCGGYAALLIHAFTAGPGLPRGGNFTSLAGVAVLLGSPMGLLAGWVHYLAFDLFIGSWEVADSPSARIPHWLLLPCLLLTFMAGPIGLLLYLCMKATRTFGRQR